MLIALCITILVYSIMGKDIHSLREDGGEAAASVLVRDG